MMNWLAGWGSAAEKIGTIKMGFVSSLPLFSVATLFGQDGWQFVLAILAAVPVVLSSLAALLKIIDTSLAIRWKLKKHKGSKGQDS